MEKLLCNEKHKPGGKYQYGFPGTMMLNIPVKQGIGAYRESQSNHTPFEHLVVNDINA